MTTRSQQTNHPPRLRAKSAGATVGADPVVELDPTRQHAHGTTAVFNIGSETESAYVRIRAAADTLLVLFDVSPFGEGEISEAGLYLAGRMSDAAEQLHDTFHSDGPGYRQDIDLDATNIALAEIDGTAALILHIFRPAPGDHEDIQEGIHSVAHDVKAHVLDLRSGAGL
jgi:hypothetical protein